MNQGNCNQLIVHKPEITYILILSFVELTIIVIMYEPENFVWLFVCRLG